MTSTGLNKSFPHIDKVCDATFLKKVTGIPTKKDTTRLILNNPDCNSFFAQMETEMIESNLKIRNKIERYFTTIPETLAKFKQELKFDRQKEKIAREHQKRELLKEELRRELELEQHAEQVRTELNLPATPIATPITTPDEQIHEPIHEPETVANVATEREIGLTEFYEYLKVVIEQELLVCYDQNQEKIEISQLDLVEDKIKLNLITKSFQPKIKVSHPIKLVSPKF